MKITVRYDGKAFVPVEPVRIAAGTEAEVEVPDKPTFEEWIEGIRKRGGLPNVVDLENLDRGDLYP